MGEYLVKDYTDTNYDLDGRNVGEPIKLAIVDDADILNALTEAKANNKEIAVYEIGKCVLDWV